MQTRTGSGGAHRRRRPSSGRGCGKRVAPLPQPRSRRRFGRERERRHGQAKGRRESARLRGRAARDRAAARAPAATRSAQEEAILRKLPGRSARTQGRRQPQRRRERLQLRGRPCPVAQRFSSDEPVQDGSRRPRRVSGLHFRRPDSRGRTRSVVTPRGHDPNARPSLRASHGGFPFRPARAPTRGRRTGSHPGRSFGRASCH
jgi:hypothetical protein